MTGMDRPRENPVGLTSDAADNVRRLNRATQGPGGYWGPWEVDQTLGNLQVLAARLSKALDQARTWLVDERAAGRLADDRPDHDGRLTVEQASAQLEIAAARATAMSVHLAGACDHTSHLTTPPREGNDG